MKPSKQPQPRPWRSTIVAAACLLPVMAAAPLQAERSPTDLEREEFLRRAHIGRTQIIAAGVTSPLRATLSLDGLTHDAQIQRVDISLRRFRTKKRTYTNFRDCYKYNIVAYRLDRLLGLNMVPVSVERRYRSDKAALTWWVDDVLMTDAERHQRDIPPPDLAIWNDQTHQARVFNQLIYNDDPNLGNFLIGTDWRLWLIDFTRAFRVHRQLREPGLLQRVDRRLYQGLQALSLETLERETRGYLSRPETRALMVRRDSILDILASRIAALGESAVVCDLPGH